MTIEDEGLSLKGRIRALVYGVAFGDAGEGYLRLCFHRRLDQVGEAADRLAEWIAKA